MSSTFTRKPGRTNTTVSAEAADLASFDLDLFDQLANQPRKTTRGIRFREVSEDEELPETDLLDDETGDEVEEEDYSEEYEEEAVEDIQEEEEEYIPVRSRRTAVSRTPVSRSSVSSRSSARTPARSSRSGGTGTTRASRTISTVSDRRFASDSAETVKSSTSRPTSGRSAYGFPVRTTANPATDSASSWRMSSITGAEQQISSDKLSDDTSLSAPTKLTPEDLAVLKPQTRKKTGSLLRFCKAMFILAVVVAGIWAIYGVSVESNLGFWQQTFRSEIAYVHDTIQSVPSPLLMMIDQP